MICGTCNSTCDSGIRCDGCDVIQCPRCSNAHVCPSEIKPLWPHQVRGIEEAFRAERDGHRAIVITSPTGGGKSRMMVDMAKATSDEGLSCAVFTNRRLLTKQMTDQLDKHGVDHEVLAAGYNLNDEFAGERIKVCSVQTMGSRVFDRGQWNLPAAKRVFIDEAHSNKADIARKIIEHYRDQGATVFGFTATPVGLLGLYSHLVIAGTNSELRRCGALVPCEVFAPDEPDMRGVKMNPVGEYVQAQATKRIMECVCFGDVFSHWKRLNPFGFPTIVFAPGVGESVWFRDEFRKRGVTAEHIDGTTTDKDREDIIEGSKDGHVKVLSSCGVLREGVDLPWIVHGILVQPCAALSTYLQIVGRLLRACPGRKDRAILQDHAGAWHRHGSPNADRNWTLGDTDKSIAKRQARDRQSGKSREPIRCPQCAGLRWVGPKCPHCGHEHKLSVRAVRMVDGTLQRMVGNVTPVKRQQTDDEKAWMSCLFVAGSSGRTVRQARGMFYKKLGRWPQGVPHMPDESDWDRRVDEIFKWANRKARA